MLDKIYTKCLKNNITFLGFDTIDGLYRNYDTKLKLKCNLCGHEWSTTSYGKFIVRTSKCPSCVNKRKYTYDEMVKLIEMKCNEMDFTFLGFLEEEKIKRSSKIKLKCNKCGVVWDTTTINNFLKKDRKSHKCGRKNPQQTPKSYDHNIVINKILKKLEGSSLNFIELVENETTTLQGLHVHLLCSKCGEKLTLTYNTIIYSKCIRCKKCEVYGKISNAAATQTVIDKCNLLDYTFLGFNTSNGKYDGKKSCLKLKCNKCGRIWTTTIYNSFIHNTITCDGCNKSWKLEKEVKYILDKNEIKYTEQQTFEWLKYKIKLHLDFYLPEYNIFIECQGRQHFVPVEAFGGEKGFEETQQRDKIKFQKCIDNNIKPIYFSTKRYKTFLGENVVTNENELIKKIKEWKK